MKCDECGREVSVSVGKPEQTKEGWSMKYYCKQCAETSECLIYPITGTSNSSKTKINIVRVP